MSLPDISDLEQKSVKSAGREGLACSRGACVACGRPIEGIARWESGRVEFYGNHHCDDRVVAKRNTMMSRGREHHDRRGWANRLSEGNLMLRLS